MVPGNRALWLNLVWRNTHADYRLSEPRRIMVLRNGKTTIVPLDELTDAEIWHRVGRPDFVEVEG